MDDNTLHTSLINEKWIPVQNGVFVCGECENESQPETNTAEGVVTANLDDIKARFEENIDKKLTIYGICPVCGMEYEFRYSEGELFLEPSSMLK